MLVFIFSEPGKNLVLPMCLGAGLSIERRKIWWIWMLLICEQLQWTCLQPTWHLSSLLRLEQRIRILHLVVKVSIPGIPVGNKTIPISIQKIYTKIIWFREEITKHGIHLLNHNWTTSVQFHMSEKEWKEWSWIPSVFFVLSESARKWEALSIRIDPIVSK